MRLNPNVLLPAILVVALAARLLFCVAVVGLDAWGWGDEPDYHRHASDIAVGRGFLTPNGEPTAARPPLYPIVLAGVYRVFGPSHAAGRIFQMVLGAGVVLLTYLVAKKLFSSDVGLVAAAFVAANPSLIYLSALLMTENLAILKKRLETVFVELKAVLGSMEISVRDVLKLQKGDIIKLDKTKISSDMELKIGNRKKFFVRPGVVGNRVAVQVTGVSESLVNEDEVFKQIEGGE